LFDSQLVTRSIRSLARGAPPASNYMRFNGMEHQAFLSFL
jgi:hypothetical protein